MYLICGEALFDCFPGAESDSGALQFEARAGGSPFNVAIGVARLGGDSALLTGISTDMLGRRLVDTLEREGIDTGYIVRSSHPTTLVMVGVDAQGQPDYTMYGADTADRSVTTSDLPPIGAEITGLHFGSYSLVVPPVADALASIAASAGGRFISIDPNVRLTVEPDLDLWRTRVTDYAALAHLLKISSEDLAALHPGVDPATKVADWLDAGVRLVVVTDGGDKVTGWRRGQDPVHVTPPRIKIRDTVGAGDTFQAALLARLAEHGNPGDVLTTLDTGRLTELLTYAATAAAITCSRRGADLPTRSEVMKSLDNDMP